MAAGATSRAARHATRTAFCTAALAFAASPFTQPAVARADTSSYYAWCMDHNNNDPQYGPYCCAQAGGTWIGTCAPAGFGQPTSPPQITQTVRPLPPPPIPAPAP